MEEKITGKQLKNSGVSSSSSDGYVSGRRRGEPPPRAIWCHWPRSVCNNIGFQYP
ncbi:hypothetical protein FIBSPDRAFT_879206, partial [Athelia psychrophila]